MADIGLLLPIAGTAIGRAWLAGCDEVTRAAVLNEVRVKTPEDWRRFEPHIEQALDDCARQGFCVTFGNLITDVCAVGVAYGRIASGDVVAFNCALQIPKYISRTPENWLQTEVGPKLLAMVHRLKESRAA
jgi:DNA-binding IclR family transcriptional regulator